MTTRLLVPAFTGVAAVAFLPDPARAIILGVALTVIAAPWKRVDWRAVWGWRDSGGGEPVAPPPAPAGGPSGLDREAAAYLAGYADASNVREAAP